VDEKRANGREHQQNKQTHPRPVLILFKGHMVTSTTTSAILIRCCHCVCPGVCVCVCVCGQTYILWLLLNSTGKVTAQGLSTMYQEAAAKLLE